MRVAASAGTGTPAAVDAAAAKPMRLAGTVVVLLLAQFEPGARWWAWARLVQGPRALREVPGLRFAKVLGSGAGGGFGLAPSASHQGLFLGFDSEAQAMAFVEASPVIAAYRARTRELCVAVLRASSSKGSWSGAALVPTAKAPLADAGPVAALTRASIKLRHARAFWQRSPAAEAALAAAPGCLLSAGLGEAPLLRQATFSLWRDTTAMDAYARSGAHLAAIRAAYGGGYFAESMFVRFVPLLLRGVWQGQRHG
jgi:hypothetical protein